MRSTKRELQSIGAATLILVASGHLPASRAAEICVMCTGPDAMYRCVVDTGLPDVTPAVRLICVSSIAGDGKHETCAVSRTIGMQGCNGPERHVKAGTLGPPPASALPEPVPATEPLKQPASPQPSAGSESSPTVQDLARQMTKSTGEQVEKAGSAISGAARKTWGCVSSFFKVC